MSIKKNKKELYNDSWMFTLLLSTLVILVEALKSYTFKIGNINLTYSLVLLPLIYLITNFITKKYNFKKSISAICLSAVAMVLFVVVMCFAINRPFQIMSIAGEFSAYIVSQFVNLTIYCFLLNNTKSPFILVFANYMFSLVVFYMFYTLIYLNLIILDTFWIGYFITLLIQIVICLFLTAIDKKIVRGREYIVKD